MIEIDRTIAEITALAGKLLLSIAVSQSVRSFRATIARVRSLSLAVDTETQNRPDTNEFPSFSFASRTWELLARVTLYCFFAGSTNNPQFPRYFNRPPPSPIFPGFTADSPYSNDFTTHSAIKGAREYRSSPLGNVNRLCLEIDAWRGTNDPCLKVCLHVDRIAIDGEV